MLASQELSSMELVELVILGATVSMPDTRPLSTLRCARMQKKKKSLNKEPQVRKSAGRFILNSRFT
jgi:hypothetical protein